MGSSEVEPLMTVVKGAPLSEEGKDMPGLMDLERAEREKLASIFRCL